MPLRVVYFRICCLLFYSKTEHFRMHGGRVPHACNLVYCRECLLTNGGEFFRLSVDREAAPSLHTRCPPTPDVSNLERHCVFRLTQLAPTLSSTPTAAAPSINPTPTAPSTARPDLSSMKSKFYGMGCRTISVMYRSSILS